MGTKAENREDFWKVHFAGLVQALCKLQFADARRDNIQAEIELREKCKAELATCIQKRNLKPFFEEYGKMFYCTDFKDCGEEQMLVAQFIKTTPMGLMDMPDILNSIKHMHMKPANVLTPKIKESITSELR